MDAKSEKTGLGQGSPSLPGTMVGTYTSGLGQFFAAEKLAGKARVSEAEDIVWTAKEKAKYWGGWKMPLGHDQKMG